MDSSKIFITSDWHFMHSRPFLWEPRGFSNQFEMNEAIIQRHNEVVGPEDEVYCLGDVCLNDTFGGVNCVTRLNGRIHLIRGNHDSDMRLAEFAKCYNVVEICDAKFLNYKGYHFFLSHYPALTANFDGDKPLMARMINLCGHSHTKDKFADIKKGVIYHCEMDAHDCRPVFIDDIITDLRGKIG